MDKNKITPAPQDAIDKTKVDMPWSGDASEFYPLILRIWPTPELQGRFHQDSKEVAKFFIGCDPYRVTTQRITTGHEGEE